MDDKVRIALLLLCFAGIGYVIYGVVDEKLTEKLDEPTIRKLYADGDVFFDKPTEMKLFLEKRLGDDFIKTGTTTVSMKEKPDQTTAMQLTKAQTVDMVIKSMSTVKLAHYKHDVSQVQLSEDGKYAYVSSTEMGDGTLDFALPDGRKVAVPMNAASSCVDTLTQRHKALYIVRTACKHAIGILQ